MKKPFILAAALIALDQAIKLIISRFAINSMVILIPGVLRFQPVQNTNLNWVASMVGYVTPVWLMIAFQVAVFILVTLLFRYLTYRSGSHQHLLGSFFVAVTAGIGCSFIDVVFWGGSLDFLGLFNWFVFDAKDIYLNASWVMMVLWLIKSEKKNSQQAATGHTQTFLHWLRKRCPAQPERDDK